jgi:hypothetical protein
MPTSKWVAISCLVAMLGTLSCSSGGSSGHAEFAAIEAQLEEALEVLAFILEELNPFSPPPAPAPLVGALVTPGCQDITGSYCDVSGTIEECPPEGDPVQIDVVFTACTGGVNVPLVINVDYEIDGTLTYQEDQYWPEGEPLILIVDDQDTGRWDYVGSFDFTADVQIFVTAPSGTEADCVGSLVTFDATCGPVSADPL